MSIAARFSQADMNRMAQHLKSMGEPFGITFTETTRLVNSRMALEASEFARENGRFDDYHDEAFHSYFTLGKNIGEMDVIVDIGQKTGLDGTQLRTALLEGRYLPQLQQSQLEAAKWGVTAAPTFIIDGKDYIVGAQPIETFRNILTSH